MRCCELSAGQLRTLIEIQAYTATPDGRGGMTQTWETVLTTSSRWRHASMYERLQAMKLNAGVMHRVYMRFSDVPTPKHRLVKDGEAFQIRGVVDLEERGRWLELSVEEGVPT